MTEDPLSRRARTSCPPSGLLQSDNFSQGRPCGGPPHSGPPYITGCESLPPQLVGSRRTRGAADHTAWRFARGPTVLRAAERLGRVRSTIKYSVLNPARYRPLLLWQWTTCPRTIVSSHSTEMVVPASSGRTNLSPRPCEDESINWPRKEKPASGSPVTITW